MSPAIVIAALIVASLAVLGLFGLVLYRVAAAEVRQSALRERVKQGFRDRQSVRLGRGVKSAAVHGGDNAR